MAGWAAGVRRCVLCRGGATGHSSYHKAELVAERVELACGLQEVRGDKCHLMLYFFIASQSEVIRAIVSDYSPCCGVPHLKEQQGVLEMPLLGLVEP